MVHEKLRVKIEKNDVPRKLYRYALKASLRDDKTARGNAPEAINENEPAVSTVRDGFVIPEIKDKWRYCADTGGDFLKSRRPFPLKNGHFC